MSNWKQVPSIDVMIDESGRCGQLVEWVGDEFRDAGNDCVSETLMVQTTGPARTEWEKSQNDAVREYQRTHVEFDQTKTMRRLYRAFEWYVASQLGSSDESATTVLDVGCGIGTMRPQYAHFMGRPINYVGLDALAVNLDRDYPFICSRIEHLCELDEFKHRFDAFIFGTSLDHFEDQAEVAESILKMAKPGAKAYFWIGLHDPERAAAEEGANLFEQMFVDVTVWSFIGRYLKFMLWQFPRIALSIFRRIRKLDEGTRLDGFHCWYFRDSDIPSVLSRYGEIVDVTELPGSNSIFCTCRLS